MTYGIRTADPQQAAMFAAFAASQGFDVIEELTIVQRVAFSTGDNGTPAQKAVFSEAQSSNIVLQTQEPKINGSQPFPGSMLFGLAAVSGTAPLSGAGFTEAQAKETADALDSAVLQIWRSSIRVATLSGFEWIDYGPGSLDNTDGVTVGRQVSVPRNLRQLAMIQTFGKDEQIIANLFTSKATAWPVAFNLDIRLHGLLARKK